MKGIILAEGFGKRLSNEIDLESVGPKTLLPINNYTLLERMVSDLASFKICTANIVVGYKADIVKEICSDLGRKYGVELHLVHNHEYLSTNTAYSLDIGLNNVNDDVVIFNGDVLYDKIILNDLLRLKQTAIVIDNKKVLTEESFKVRVINNQIVEMGKIVPIQRATGEFIGISKIIKDDIEEAKRLLKMLISNDIYCYYDLIYQHLSVHYNLAYLFTNGLKWTEVDDINDFEYAKSIVFMVDKTRELGK